MNTMHGLMTSWWILAIATLPLGCEAATKQAKMEEQGSGLILEDLSILRPGKESEAVWVYRNEKADWDSYTKVLVDAVLFRSPANASHAYLSDLQKLATNLHTHLVNELGQDLEVVTEPGPGTIRVQTAFYNPEEKGSTHVISSVIPVGLVVSLTKDFITGKPLSVGEISAEAKLTDAQTGEILGEGLDRRVGTQWGKGMLDSWAEANDAVRFWAQRMRYALCLLRGEETCVPPKP